LQAETKATAATTAEEISAPAGVKAVAEAKSAVEADILKNESRTTCIFISGVKGPNSVINGLYSPTQETGQDGRTIYLKSGEIGDEALCIEHFGGQWQVKNQSDRGSSLCCAFVEGGCALEYCRLREWRVVDVMDFVAQPSVSIVAVAEAN
jgi:hypothetical protein